MKKILVYLLIAAFIPAFPGSVFAVGSGAFENATFSADALGQSNAVVAQADEPAAISYNPAGITQLKGVQFQANSAFLSIVTTHSGPRDASTKSAGTINTVPTAYLTINPGKALNDRLALGIGSDSPFGLANKYNSNESAVHYTGYRNWLKMYTIKPTAAFKITDWLSVGGGPMYYRIFDFGGVLAYPNTLIVNGTADGQLRANLSGNSWGWQFGTLLKLHRQHQLGFYFRSPVEVRTRGLIKVERGGGGVGSPTRFETGGNAKINLPLNFTLGYAFKPTNKTTIETDFGVTGWGHHRKLYIYHNSVNAFDDAIIDALGLNDKDFNNSCSLHLGGKHKLTDKLTLMAGTLFYWTPVPKDHWIPAVPDSNSIAFSLGVGYELTKNLLAEVTYFNRIWLRRKIDNSIGEAIGTTVDGRYTSVLNDLAISLTYKWDNIFDKSVSAERDDAQKEALTFFDTINK